MSDLPTVLSLLPREPDQVIVEELEKLLAQARTGELRSIVVAGETTEAFIIFHRGRRFVLLGALAYLSHQISDRIAKEP